MLVLLSEGVERSEAGYIVAHPRGRRSTVHRFHGQRKMYYLINWLRHDAWPRQLPNSLTWKVPLSQSDFIEYWAR